MPDFPAIEDIGRHLHDAFFRAMLADLVRADAVVRTHWPRQLRWLLDGAPVRPAHSQLVRCDLRQLRTDALFLVGGEGCRPGALFLSEHTFRAGAWVPGKMCGYARTVLDGYDVDETPWLVSTVFDTGSDGGRNLPGAIDESSDDPMDIVRQMRPDGAYFGRLTRRMEYGQLSSEPVSRAMLGMMGLAGLQPYPRDALEWMWRRDAAGRVASRLLQTQMLTFALTTSDLPEAELRELALKTGLVEREVDMGMITQPLILDAVKRGKAEGKAEGSAELLLHQCRQRFGEIPKDAELRVRSAPLCDLETWAVSILRARSLDEVFQNGKSG